jgi:hypothetical protein
VLIGVWRRKQITRLASREVNFTSFSCSTGSFAATVPYWPKRTQSEKPLNASTARLNLRHVRVVAR